eukprot:4037794-Pyramimonas_sp.AAC.1
MSRIHCTFVCLAAAKTTQCRREGQADDSRMLMLTWGWADPLRRADAEALVMVSLKDLLRDDIPAGGLPATSLRRQVTNGRTPPSHIVQPSGIKPNMGCTEDPLQPQGPCLVICVGGGTCLCLRDARGILSGGTCGGLGWVMDPSPEC